MDLEENLKLKYINHCGWEYSVTIAMLHHTSSKYLRIHEGKEDSDLARFLGYEKRNIKKHWCYARYMLLEISNLYICIDISEYMSQYEMFVI